MKKLTNVLILTLAVAVSAAAFAGPPDRGRRGPPPDGSPAMEIVGHMHHALKRLDLSDAQQTAIKAEFQAMKKNLDPLMEALRDNRASLHEQLMADDYDAAAVAKIADQQGSITADMIKLAGKTVHTVKGELTDEQIAQLDEMREERRDRMRDHLGHMHKRLDRMDENG